MVFQLLLVVKKIWMDLFLDSTHLNPHFDDEFAYFWGVTWLWDWISTEKVGLEALKTLKEKEATTVAALALRIAGDSNHIFGDDFHETMAESNMKVGDLPSIHGI